MTRDQVAADVLSLVLTNEGGIADVHDGKGITRFGQTQDWLTEFGLSAPNTAEDARSNYRTWLNKTRLIELCDVLDALAVSVIDFAVNSDHRRAIRAMQSALGALRPDGVIGPITIERLGEVNRRNVGARVICDRNAYLFGLIADNPTKHGPFARVWARRMSGQILWLIA